MSTVSSKNKNSVTIAELGCHRSCGKHYRRSKWSNLGEFLQSVHEEFPSNIINKSGNLNAFSEFSLLRPFHAQGFNPGGRRACLG